MPMDEELPPPTMGEVGRAVLRVEGDIKELRHELATGYVPKELWLTEHQNKTHRIDDLFRSVEKLFALREADRRLIITSFISPIITGVLIALIVSQL